ncbi:nuclease [Sporanaerobium hydrogeniformans]|uniref:Nuclease n=2 Tax=Sporanaerobium hydrogeniformans TaxID=3072179 RepID=A0AC61D696_9FIRM|nr:nuclease [Sporanaerobium hydrogeniformans]
MGTESQEQMVVFRWAAYEGVRRQELKLLYHVPNGGKRDIGTAKRLKIEGVKAGVPDICLPVSRGGYHGLYIELKVGKNKPTVLQREWIENLKKEGYFVEVCYGSQEAIKAIESYLQMMR